MIRDFAETLEWYRENTTTREIGFNPDNMCLKVCRTARFIPALHPTAKIAQDATPERYRVHRVRDLRKGMVLYFDDPNDSNRAGHIVTMQGRVKGFDEDDLNDVLVLTNSVVSGKLVTVRASYFQKHWGDEFQFGSNYLNGIVLDVYGRQSRVEKFRRSGPNWNLRLLDDAAKAGRRDIAHKLREIDKVIDTLSDDKRKVRVAQFKKDYRQRRILRMPLLNDIVQTSDPDRSVRRVRNRLRQTLKSLPES